MTLFSLKRKLEAKLLLLVAIVLSSTAVLFYLTQPGPFGQLIIAAGLVLIVLFYLMHLVLSWWAPETDQFLLPAAALLTTWGLIFIYHVDPQLGARQWVWAVLGLLLACLIIFFWHDYHWLMDYKYIFMSAGLIFLALTIAVGEEAGGAKSWLSLGVIRFQPAEAVKLLLIFFLAAYLAENAEILTVTKSDQKFIFPEFKTMGPIILMWGLTLLLLGVQKDLGAGLIFFGVFLAMLYIATGRWTFFISGIVVFALGSLTAYYLFAHIRTRVAVWLNPWPFAHGAGYQIIQSLFILAEGGVLGTGIGLSNPNYLPAAATDFIFTVAAGELGFLGAVVILSVYLIIGYRGLRLSLEAPDEFGLLLTAGLSLLFSIQTLVIIGGIIKILPLTGVTLPFMSYGGSSLLVSYILVGMLLSLGAQFRLQKGKIPDEN